MALCKRNYTIVNATPGVVEGKTVVDGEEATFTKPAVFVDLVPDREANGSVKLVFTGDEQALLAEFAEGKKVVGTFEVQA